MFKQMTGKEKLRYKIDQLRKDNIISALESVAFTFIAELGYFLITLIIGKTILWLAYISLALPLLYFSYMIIGNTIRRRNIKNLEKRLYK